MADTDYWRCPRCGSMETQETPEGHYKGGDLGGNLYKKLHCDTCQNGWTMIPYSVWVKRETHGLW